MSELSSTDIEKAKKLASLSKISSVLENIREVIARDKMQKQPLILRINEGFIFDVARKAIQEKDSTFLISIAGESASGKTTLVQNTAKACVKSDTNNVYTVVNCDDYYKDASKELKSAGNYENLFQSGFSFDTPEAIDLDHITYLEYRLIVDRRRVVCRDLVDAYVAGECELAAL